LAVLSDQPWRVAVGTRIAPRPPRRSQRALLTHWAPPSGSSVEGVQRLRVQYTDRREEAVGEPGELGPQLGDKRGSARDDATWQRSRGCIAQLPAARGLPRRAQLARWFQYIPSPD